MRYWDAFGHTKLIFYEIVIKGSAKFVFILMMLNCSISKTSEFENGKP